MSNGYTCQRCYQPLVLDASLEDINPNQQRTLIDASRASRLELVGSPRDIGKVPGPRESKDAYLQAQSTERSRKARIGPAESFILLSQSQLETVPRSSGSHSDGFLQSGQANSDSHGVSSLGTVDYLLQQLSSTTGIDHPLCTSCATLLQGILQEKLEDVQIERDAYISFEREWQTKRDESKAKGTLAAEHDEFEELKARKQKLEQEEESLMDDLRSAEEEERALEQELKDILEEDKQLELEETKFLEEREQLQSRNVELEAQLRTETTLHLLATQTLRRLESTNVYNDVFQIGHVPLGDPQVPHRSSNNPVNGSHSDRWASTVPSGTSQTVGTINGLRLGGRPWVDWVEINAALGLVALCIHRIAHKIGLTFESYNIVPMGSISRIEELPPSKNVYELYASTDLSPARWLQNRRFNYALVGMLDCLRQLIAYGKSIKKGWATGGLDITKDKIAGHPIKLSANMGMSSLGIVGAVPGSSVVQSTEAEESWTKALRAVLAVLKRILIVESETEHVSQP